MEQDIRDVYREDTVGKKIMNPITTKHEFSPLKDPNGVPPVYSVITKSPITYAELKKLTKTLQVTYINELRTQYGATRKDIAEMLGVEYSGFCKYCKNGLHMNKISGRVKKQTPEQLEAWRKFLGCTEPDKELNVTEENREVEAISEPTEEVTPKTAPRKEVEQFSYKGALNIEKLCNIIRALGVEGEPCDVSVFVTFKGGE